jgi:hypothetical protein
LQNAYSQRFIFFKIGVFQNVENQIIKTKIDGGSYVTQVACITLSLGDGRYNGEDKLKITNPTVVLKFLSQVGGDISAKVA